MIENSILLWTLVGSASGTILGLAGTGGGIVAIPLLMILGGYDIKDASAYGLLSLSVGAALSWFIQRKNTLYLITAVLILCAGMTAYLSASLKAISPPWVIIALLNITCLLSLYGLWILQRSEDSSRENPLPYRLKAAAIGGVIVGFLSTMTGLGGGVIIIPWLTSIGQIKFKEAIACSLLTIAITAPFSVWRQREIDLTLEEWLGLIGGILVTALIIRTLSSQISPLKMVLVNKLSLTGVILFSMYRTLAELF